MLKQLIENLCEAVIDRKDMSFIADSLVNTYEHVESDDELVDQIMQVKGLDKSKVKKMVSAWENSKLRLKGVVREDDVFDFIKEHLGMMEKYHA